MRDLRTWDRESVGKCRESDDYYRYETCTEHQGSYMDFEDTECERVRLARAQAQIQKVREVRDYMMNDPAQVYYRQYEYAMRLLSAALDGGDGDE